MKKWIFLVLAATLSMQVVLAQKALAEMEVRSQVPSWRRSTALVLFSGIGGGILGLSTLSFYGDPKEHTANITWGALFGLVAGAGYIIYENSPSLHKTRITNDYYGLFDPTQMQKKGPTLSSVPTFQFEFTSRPCDNI